MKAESILTRPLRRGAIPGARLKGMAQANPFQDPLRFERRVPSCAVVIFGANGDLTKRKLLPSLYRLAFERRLPQGFAVIGMSRTAMSDDDFRRMVYQAKPRSELDSFFGAFDCPDGSLVMPRRSISTTPLQALNLYNSRFTLHQAEEFSQRLRREAGAAPAAQVRAAWRLAYGREPSPGEREEAEGFAAREGMPALCRAVLNSNEFLFIP